MYFIDVIKRSIFLIPQILYSLIAMKLENLMMQVKLPYMSDFIAPYKH